MTSCYCLSTSKRYKTRFGMWPGWLRLASVSVLLSLLCVSALGSLPASMWWRAGSIIGEPCLDMWFRLTPQPAVNPGWDTAASLNASQGRYIATSKFMITDPQYSQYCMPALIHESGRFIWVYWGGTTKVWQLCHYSGDGIGQALLVAVNTSADLITGTYRRVRANGTIASDEVIHPTSAKALNWAWREDGLNSWVAAYLEASNIQGDFSVDVTYDLCSFSWESGDNPNKPFIEPAGPMDEPGWFDPTDPEGAYQGMYWNDNSQSWVIDLSSDVTPPGPEAWYLAELLDSSLRQEVDNHSLLSETQYMDQRLQNIEGALDESNDWLSGIYDRVGAGSSGVTVNVDAPIVNVNVDAPIVNVDAPIVNVDAPIVNVDAPIVNVSVTNTGSVDLSSLTGALYGVSITGVVASIDAGTNEAAIGSLVVGVGAGAADVDAARLERQGAWATLRASVSSAAAGLASGWTVQIGEDWADWVLTVPLTSFAVFASDLTLTFSPITYDGIILVFRRLCILELMIWAFRRGLALLGWGLQI